jgi:hypothetical protein
MKVREKHEAHVCFSAEEGDQLVVAYDNRGDPYREGISLTLHEPDKPYRSYVFLNKTEAGDLRDLINRLFPPRTLPVPRPDRGGQS